MHSACLGVQGVEFCWKENRFPLTQPLRCCVTADAGVVVVYSITHSCCGAWSGDRWPISVRTGQPSKHWACSSRELPGGQGPGGPFIHFPPGSCRGAQMRLRRLNHGRRKTRRTAARARKEKTVLFIACAVGPKQRWLLVRSVLSPFRVVLCGAELRCRRQVCPEPRGACADRKLRY